ncbi:U2 snRNP-associated SURP motif-containing protein [Anthonomus grandis grandis]|uniref:U2 snRNP-associated SURP motif-containing protein n=1 Tax=Anthonomus grandis grandis TaxID=2921223 RepID=UPI0021665BF1|nr:U2 snRNP-associated SURP motif-containing protein [Anthonomus grandis grandis]
MSEKLKNIPEQKLKAFSIGTMGKRTLSKRELEEQRKREEEKAAAHVFQEFVETFQEAPLNGSSKVWVKAGTFDAGSRKEDTKDKGQLYKPTAKFQPSSETLSSTEKAQAFAKLLSIDTKKPAKSKRTGKSNLESFMEELKQIQEEREERHKYKSYIKTPIENELDMFMRGDLGSFDNGDPNTTNIYLGNLNPKLTEPQLMEIFGRYGPLASIKIMWPRSDEEKARGRNCGFVAYMSRKDGERALRNLNGKDIFGYEMKLGWGKAVVIPTHPIYIPPILMEVSQPPPPSGLPFNAQPASEDRDVLPQTNEELELILSRAVIKVVLPNDKNLIMLIHRMVEFVVREGPMFEAMIMNRELLNPQFRFLFENQSPAHIYYRWKVYSILHGDAQKEWRNKEFRMFKGGSVWKPPVMHSYTAGMPDDLINDDDILRDSSKGALSKGQRDRLEDIIRNITPEKKRIGEAMIYCIDHSEAAEEIVECITESLSNESTLITKKIARLYVVSDILSNCGVKVNKASNYRKIFQDKLFDIIREIKKAYDSLESRLQAEGFKVRVLRVLKSWEDAGIYTLDFMTKLHNAFLGLDLQKGAAPEKEDDLDGNPLDHNRNSDEDGVPIDGAALLKNAMSHYNSSPEDEEDIDGEEIKEDPADLRSLVRAGFTRSKWEAVDPDQVEAQAMTTSKWDLLENSQENTQDSSGNPNDNDSPLDYGDTRNMTEERRQKLREIEVKAVQYQDELESGQRSLKSGWSVPQQVEHYRRKLLKKSEKESKKEVKAEKTPKHEKHKKDKDYEKSERRLEEGSDDEYYNKEHTSRKSKKHARSSSTGSTSRHRSRSRSPTRKRTRQQSRSPTPPRSRRPSPSSSRSSRKRRDSPGSPISSTSRYSPPHSTSRHSRLSPSPVRSSKRSRNRSSSPKRRSRSTSRTRYYSPDSTSTSSRKHRHKHKY